MQNRPILTKLSRSQACFSVDLVYAGTQNSFYKDMYSEHGITECYMLPDMRDRLMRLIPTLSEQGLKLVIFDAFRPWVVQKFMYETSPDYLKPYIAPPPEPDSTRGFHPRGAAIDCYLADRNGRPLIFPTEADAFYPGYENDPKYEKYLDKCHRSYNEPDLPDIAYKNRQLLEDMMVNIAGLMPLPHEWWHFNLPDATKYPIIYSLSDADIV